MRFLVFILICVSNVVQAQEQINRLFDLGFAQCRANIIALDDSVKNLIAKISNAGELLWIKDVAPPIPNSNTDLYGIEKDQFGYYTAVGHTGRYTQNDSLNSLVQVWIIKFDDDGNIVTTDQITGTSSAAPPNDYNILVYPNPAARVVYIDQKIDGNYIYKLMDAAGQGVLPVLETDRSGIYIMHTDAISPGLYYLKGVDKTGNIVAMQKVVVE